MKQLTEKQKKISTNIILIIVGIIILSTILFAIKSFLGIGKTKQVSVQKYELLMNLEENVSHINNKKKEKENIEVIVLNEGQEMDIRKLGKKTEEDIAKETAEQEENEEKEKNIEENTEKETEKNQEQVVSTKKYYIKVNNTANTVTIYEKDADGEYTVPVKAMICSTGESTPQSEIHEIKERWEWLSLINGVYGHYSTQIVGNILFHSVPYLEKGNPASLEYWEYDKLGTTCSAGCVRLTIADAKWIYYNVPRGTLVEFYSDSNPGPLGKPAISKISDNIECRDWDPTDDNDINPWYSYGDSSEIEEYSENAEETNF